MLVVRRDVAANLPSKVGERFEDAASEQVAFDLAKPEFHLVEPGRVGGREMQVDRRMRRQKRVDGLRLVGGQVVNNDMDGPSGMRRHDIAEELNKRRAGMARHGLTHDLARARVQRRVQRERAMPEMLEAVTLCAPLRQTWSDSSRAHRF